MIDGELVVPLSYEYRITIEIAAIITLIFFGSTVFLFISCNLIKSGSKSNIFSLLITLSESI